jgi:membrane associated rhomboid family serine protease
MTTGMLGNFLNIVLRQEQHLSVGFSTAVFATLGIFTGLKLQFNKTTALKDVILPLGAGAGLLVFFGSEGARTDIGAHFFGFLCGLIAGIICNLTRIVKKAATADKQAILLATTFSLVALSWFFAYQNIMNHTY